MAESFKLPDLGEGIESAEVVNVMVNEGDTIAQDDPIVEVETDKAVMEVPSSVAGKITSVKVKKGASVNVGDVLIEYEAGEASQGESQEDQSADQQAEQPAQAEASESKSEQAEAKVEHGGTAASGWSDGDGAQAASESSGVDSAPAGSAPTGNGTATPQDEQAQRTDEPAPAGSASQGPVFAAPSVRQFAREIGLDIHKVEGTGPGGRISMEDVKKHARTHGSGAQTFAPTAAHVHVPDLSRFGPVQREPMSKVRRVTAAHLSSAWTAPHVTLHDKVDVTDLEEFRQQFKQRVEKAGGKLTVTALMLKIVATGLKQHPIINATLDLQNNHVIYRESTHVGVAADTPRGLVVPVVRDAADKSLTDLAAELNDLAGKARDGKLTPDDMSGGTFTITNLGGIGIGHFTPIINAPESAILGLGRAVNEPVWNEQAQTFEPRLMMPLSLSFDHRLIDGADGARFLRWIVQAVEQPLMLSLS